MKSIFAKQKSQATLQRNAFDLSYSNKFTASPGMLLPCYVQECNPNEHFVIRPQSFLRTMPLNTASFVRAKQNIEFYFVPMRVLYRQFQQFVVGTKYEISSINSLNSYKGDLPTFSIADFLDLISSQVATPKQRSVEYDIAGFPKANAALRLLDLLGYGVGYLTGKVDDSTNKWTLDNFPRDADVTPFRLLAYQKVYYDFYRNPLYEINNASAYNIDSHDLGDTLSSSEVYNSGISTLRYRNFKKDYFNSVSPYFQGADYLTDATSAPTFDAFTGSGLDGSNFGKPQTYSKQGNMPSISNQTNANIFNSMYGFTIANLRSAFALDKLYRLSIAAGDGDYGSQIRAHYGFNAVHDDWKASFIGGISEPIQISEVLSTAETTSPVGDIFGRGLSASSNGSFTFDTREHGIIIGIFSVIPECDYNGFMLDRFNQKIKREDFYQPEFADLGLQPVSSYELQFGEPNTDWRKTPENLGYINRYAEYKTRVDTIHGEFQSFYDQGSFRVNGSLSQWCAPRQQNTVVGGYKITNAFLKVRPSIFNNISSVQYNGLENTDIFLVDTHFSVSAVRPMSVSGLPSL